MMHRGFLVWTLGLVSCLWASIAAQTNSDRPQTADEVFKNVRILKGIPVDEFMGTMGFFSAALGLNCTDCHVDESGGSWARYADDNQLKQKTRVMMEMMNAINRANFGGRQVVTCNTCHRGNRRPNVMPSLDALYGQPPLDEPGEPVVPAAGQPSPDQVLERFIVAVGGTERLAALRGFVANGLYLGFDDADKASFEIFATAAGQRTTVIHGLSGDTTMTFDGKNGWIAAPPTDRPVPLLTVTGQEVQGMKLEAAVAFPTRLKEVLTNWRAGSSAVIDDREVRVLQGTTADGGVATLCFDTDTGLLVRLVRYGSSPVGRIVTRIDYSDYRDVEGAKLPFRWTVSWLSGRSTYELTAVQLNVPIDAARFERPRPFGE